MLTSLPTDTAAPLPVAQPQEAYSPDLVARWDELIDWDRRRASEGSFFADLLRGYGAQEVLDAATGTGFHSVALAEAGFEVTSLDGSVAMLRRAVANARRRGRLLQPVVGDWRDLGSCLARDYDAVVCLGSSFPHLLDRGDRERALDNFRQALRPGGVLVLDHRNFDALRAGRYANRRRHYYCGADVDIRLEQLDADLCRIRYRFADGASFHLDFYPLPAREMHDLLTQAGFVVETTFGDFRADGAIADADFLIQVARKPLG
jgi:glycine/sarcosine N-methyltransferase